MQNLQPLYGAPNAERVFRTCEVRTRSTTFLCHRCFGADRFFLCHRCFGADRFLLHDTGTSLMVDFSTSFGIGKAAVTQRDGQDSPEYRPWSIMLQGPHIVASLFLVGQGSNYIGHFVLAAGRLLVFCTAGLLRAACSEWNSGHKWPGKSAMWKKSPPSTCLLAFLSFRVQGALGSGVSSWDAAPLSNS